MYAVPFLADKKQDADISFSLIGLKMKPRVNKHNKRIFFTDSRVIGHIFADI
ncbi:hypothetical protein B14911_26880 [Bacillus sp. NRRL B-14911]|uniref:Uncharacterized protein n=1 Tax=Bacillus infantis NRRL B-14911 TaxID=1367477 RepID=U5LAX7_9BACI|nr:hypothetical protein N288_13390 [Bacillus infantis NRRL B-14911]EAR68353.1 hypothetical protein B14911_26880 [Bacillus sp. NRRL B-14911]